MFVYNTITMVNLHEIEGHLKVYVSLDQKKQKMRDNMEDTGWCVKILEKQISP